MIHEIPVKVSVREGKHDWLGIIVEKDEMGNLNADALNGKYMEAQEKERKEFIFASAHYAHAMAYAVKAMKERPGSWITVEDCS